MILHHERRGNHRPSDKKDTKPFFTRITHVLCLYHSDIHRNQYWVLIRSSNLWPRRFSTTDLRLIICFDSKRTPEIANVVRFDTHGLCVSSTRKNISETFGRKYESETSRRWKRTSTLWMKERFNSNFWLCTLFPSIKRLYSSESSTTR